MSRSFHLVSHTEAALRVPGLGDRPQAPEDPATRARSHSQPGQPVQPPGPTPPQTSRWHPLLIPRTSHHSSFLLREAGPSPRLGALTPHPSQHSGPPLAGQGHCALHLGAGVRPFCSLEAGAEVLLSRSPTPIPNQGRLLLATGNVSISRCICKRCTHLCHTGLVVDTQTGTKCPYPCVIVLMDLSGKQARSRVPSGDEPQSSLRTGGLQAAAAMVGPVCFQDQLAGCHLQEALQATQEGQVPAPWAPQGCDPPLVQPFCRSSLTESPHSQLPVPREGLILPRVRVPWGHADRNYSL